MGNIYRFVLSEVSLFPMSEILEVFHIIYAEKELATIYILNYYISIFHLVKKDI